MAEVCNRHPDRPATHHLNRPAGHADAPLPQTVNPDTGEPVEVVTAVHDGPVPLCRACTAELRQYAVDHTTDPEAAMALITEV